MGQQLRRSLQLRAFYPILNPGRYMLHLSSCPNDETSNDRFCGDPLCRMQNSAAVRGTH